MIFVLKCFFFFNFYQRDARNVIYAVSQADDIAFSAEFVNWMKLLWNDGGVRACFLRAREYQLNDSAE